MRYLSPFLLLLVAFGCSKAPKSGPVITQPTIDTPETRIFRGEYVMFDSVIYWGTTTYPTTSGKEEYQTNRVVKIEIDSVNDRIIFGYDTFRRESPASSKYARKWGAPSYWYVTDDSTTFYFWDSKPGHTQVNTYVRGYRKR